MDEPADPDPWKCGGTGDWLRSWTGNKELTGAQFRVMGQDGSGGYAAFCLVHEGRPVAEQPVVFLSSESRGQGRLVSNSRQAVGATVSMGPAAFLESRTST